MATKNEKKDIKSEITDEFEKAEQNPVIIIEEFTNLLNQPGWIRAKEIFDKKVKLYESEILDTDIQGEELNRLRDRRDLCLYFRDLPDTIITALRRKAESSEPVLDPYERVERKDVDKG